MPRAAATASAPNCDNSQPARVPALAGEGSAIAGAERCGYATLSRARARRKAGEQPETASAPPRVTCCHDPARVESSCCSRDDRQNSARIDATSDRLPPPPGGQPRQALMAEGRTLDSRVAEAVRPCRPGCSVLWLPLRCAAPARGDAPCPLGFWRPDGPSRPLRSPGPPCDPACAAAACDENGRCGSFKRAGDACSGAASRRTVAGERGCTLRLQGREPRCARAPGHAAEALAPRAPLRIFRVGAWKKTAKRLLPLRPRRAWTCGPGEGERRPCGAPSAPG